MKDQILNRLIGHYCKIVMKEPGDTKVHVVTGTIQEIDQHAGFLIVKSINGFWCLNINEILAIKPKKIINS
jgi:hypothetical protein